MLTKRNSLPSVLTAKGYLSRGVWEVAHLPGCTTDRACRCGFLLRHGTALAFMATRGNHAPGDCCVCVCVISVLYYNL